jgi:hypothetical protein
MSSQTRDNERPEAIVALRISAAKRDAFRKIAEANERTVSAEIRWMIEERLKRALPDDDGKAAA